MRKITSIVLAASAMCLFSTSCKQKPADGPQAEGPSAPEASPALPAPPTPKPGCESLDEHCQALPETDLDVPNSGARFRPPASWTYAKEGAFALAVAPDSQAVLAFTAASNAEPDTTLAALEQLFAKLMISGVKPAAIKARLKKPDTVLPSEGGELKLWELDRRHAGAKPELKGKPGSLLIVQATFGTQVTVGAGFVVKPEAEAQAAPIMASVQSLRGAQ
jgi:hypothetical protein